LALTNHSQEDSVSEHLTATRSKTSSTGSLMTSGQSGCQCINWL